MAASVLILDTHPTIAIELVPWALALLALVSAGLVRDLEIRVRLALRRVYFAGSADSLRELKRELVRSPEASLVGAVGARAPFSSEALAQSITDSRATVLVFDREAAHAPTIVAAAAALSSRRLHVRDLLGYYESEFEKVPLTELTPAWFLFEHPDQHRRALSTAVRRAIVMARRRSPAARLASAARRC